MRTVKNYLAIMVFALLCAITFNGATAKAASTVTAIPVTVTDDINYEALDEKSVGDTVVLTAEEAEQYKKTFSFTLAKPAYVKTSVYSTVGFSNYTNLGAHTKYSLTYNESGSNLVKGTSTTEVGKDAYHYNYLILDAGTYYINVRMTSTSYTSSGDYRISVIAQYSDEITRNVNKEKATSVQTDKVNTGLITATTRNSWYKFNISTNSVVNINTWLSSAWSTDRGSVQAKPMAVTLWDSRNNVVAYWNNSVYNEGFTKQNITLPKGTYYLSFYGGQYYSYKTWGQSADIDYNLELTKTLNTGTTETTAIRNGGEIHFKITTIKAPTSVKASNQKGKKVKLTYKKPAGAEGFDIQYSIKKNFSSGVKTKNTKKTSYTISKLSKGKTYYVRVRAYRYDDDGNKLCSSWVIKKVTVKK